MKNTNQTETFTGIEPVIDTGSGLLCIKCSKSAVYVDGASYCEECYKKLLDKSDGK